MGYEEALRRIEEARETGATELDLGGQGLTELPPELFQLTDISELDLSSNPLTSLPSAIGQLIHLTSLGLIQNHLSSLPPELFQLTELAELDLSNNQLTSLPPEIGQLINLRELDLSSNPLTCLPSEIGQLAKLNKFLVILTRLATLPSETGQLINLSEFQLQGNQLTNLPAEIGQLTNLIELHLSDNDLSTLPPEIVYLSKLKVLSLDGNQFVSVPQKIVQLPNLTSLWLNFNQLTSLPPEIAQLPKLKELNVQYNPLTSPPYELAIQGIEAIREYFASLEEEEKEVAEVKLLLVGEGAAGKTSLTRCLRGEEFNPHEATTHGIRIKRWQLTCACRDLRCNLWDFGGQEIMHATHQFFLSRRSLYVLVLDGRRDERPEYWLRYIESFGGGSPVLVVLNKQDTNPSFDVDRIALQRKFPFIKGFWQTACSTGLGVEAFQQALHQELGKVPFIETRWANAWFLVKEELEQMDTPCISYDEFEATCRNAGVKEKISRETLLAFLHDLGIVIHFTEFELEENHVLDPKWVTEGVYAIINAPSLAASKGLLKLLDLREIFRCAKDCCYQYGHEDYRYLVGLMKKFELCYELDDEHVFIPQLFAVQEPEFAFDDQDALCFELRYEDFLPASVMPRFIVNRHKEIQGDLRWRNGVVLKNTLLNASALVRADNETKRIHIAVTGKERKVFLALIWLTFRELHTGFEGLKVSERVPMPDDPKRSVPYKTLLTYREKGLEQCIPEDSEQVYSVQELLDAVHPDNEQEGERMRVAVQADKREGRLRRAVKALNKYGEWKPNVMGVGFNFNAWFDELLNKEGK